MRTRTFDNKFLNLAAEVIPDEIYTEKLCEDLAGALQEAFDEWLGENDPAVKRFVEEMKNVW